MKALHNSICDKSQDLGSAGHQIGTACTVGDESHGQHSGMHHQAWRRQTARKVGDRRWLPRSTVMEAHCLEGPGHARDEYVRGTGGWRVEGDILIISGGSTTFKKDPKYGEQVVGSTPIGAGRFKIEKNTLRDLSGGQIWEKR